MRVRAISVASTAIVMQPMPSMVTKRACFMAYRSFDCETRRRQVYRFRGGKAIDFSRVLLGKPPEVLLANSSLSVFFRNTPTRPPPPHRDAAQNSGEVAAAGRRRGLNCAIGVV